MIRTTLILFLVVLTRHLELTNGQAKEAKPEVPWLKKARFQLLDDLTDEFDNKQLNETKWDPHGLRNLLGDCPRWNGPTRTFNGFTNYSTFFPSSTSPKDPSKKLKFYRIKKGQLRMRIDVKDEGFFADREYYCDKAANFTCNHNASISCFTTDIFGDPILNADGDFMGMNHDKCKIEPFCIPHYQFVLDKDDPIERPYRKYVSAHFSSKKLFRYGFVETRVKLSNSSAILAVWMHDDNFASNSFCRYLRKEGKPGVEQQCPSLIRSRRWQEIDLVEHSNSDFQRSNYMPNMHVFSANKGEFTSANASTNPPDGGTGGGPIIVRNAFIQNPPSFTDVADVGECTSLATCDAAQDLRNDFHWNPGNVTNLPSEWASDWRVAGLYWSPTEIRLYIDGVEVKRLQNSIIHQPMYLDLSSSINRIFTRQEPDDARVRKWSKIDYIRTWSVEIKNGQDPPSDLPLDTDLIDEFDDKYAPGDLLSVFDRFPWTDGLTVLPADVADLDNRFPADASDAVPFTAPLLNDALDGNTSPNVSWVAVGPQGSADSTDSTGTKNPTAGGKTTRPFNGMGNRRWPANPKVLTEDEKRYAYARPDRNIPVARGKDGKFVETGKLKDPAITAVDLSDPLFEGS